MALVSLSVKGQTAMDIACEMYPGWNLGNTLEAVSTWENNRLKWETTWQGTKTSQAVIDFVKEQGFRAVRIPCAWYMHSDTNNQIDVAWMDRVQEIVDYCFKAGLYVVLNDHWDNGWVENSFGDVSEATVAKNCSIMTKMWTQIAERFKDYDHHLLFAGLNEPNVDDAAKTKALLRYEQAFIDAVRATGGRNASRVLVVQGPSTDIDQTNILYNTLPIDTAPHALMVEVHFYAPYNFAMMIQDEPWGHQAYYWGKSNHVSGSIHNATWGEESWMLGQFKKMKKKFVDKGIPVLLGEFAAIWRTMPSGEDQEKHNQSIYQWYKTVCQYSINHGMLPFVWDTNACDRSLSHPCGDLLNRQTLRVYNSYAMNGITDGIAAGTWPYASTIESVEGPSIEEKPAPAYNLVGLRVGDDHHGIMIRNGRKMLVK